jgi:hypothetical protein
MSNHSPKYNEQYNTLTGLKENDTVNFKLMYNVNSENTEFLVVITPTGNTTDRFINISSHVVKQINHIRFIVEFNLKVIDNPDKKNYYSFAFQKIISSTYEVVGDIKNIENIVSTATKNINDTFKQYGFPNITFTEDSSKNTSTQKPKQKNTNLTKFENKQTDKKEYDKLKEILVASKNTSTQKPQQKNIDNTIKNIITKLANKQTDKTEYTKLIQQLNEILVASKDDNGEFSINIDKIKNLIIQLKPDLKDYITDFVRKNITNKGGNKKDLKRHKKNTTIRNRKK